MEGKAVQLIQEGAQTTVVSVNGREYSSKPVHNPPFPEEPLPKVFQLHTLTGLAGYVNNILKSERNVEAAPIIHIGGHDHVGVLSSAEGENRQRAHYAAANVENLFGGTFKIGTFYDLEAFIIALQSLFVESDDQQAILKLVSNIRSEAVKTDADDGISQTVTAKAGVASVTEVQVPRIVSLAPWRTFREIEQPYSKFILRMRAADPKPQAALFEADGGLWKLHAIDRIRDYLAEHVTYEGVTIIG